MEKLKVTRIAQRKDQKWEVSFLPQEKQNLKSKREISEKTSVPVSTVATIIRKTPKADLENFLSKQAQPSSAGRST